MVISLAAESRLKGALRGAEPVIDRHLENKKQE